MSSTALEAYVRRLSEELRRRWLDDERLVAESREHLVDRIENGARRGLSRDAAEQQAFGGFGSPEAVAECAAAERYQMWNRWGLLAVVWDRKWWILIPTIASGVIASVASYYVISVRYQSEASLELIPVSTEYVPGRMRAMSVPCCMTTTRSGSMNAPDESASVNRLGSSPSSDPR